VPIEISVPRSPGWWMQRLFTQLNDRHRRRRLQLLHDYYRGRGPLPAGAEVARESFEGFQRKARTNYAAMIVGATSERMRIGGFKSAVDSDVSGDAFVGRLWKRAGMKVVSTKVHDRMLALGEAYAIVGLVDEDTGAPLITAEDPRTMIAEEVPGNPHKLLAALKILHDDTVGEDRAYLYLPGVVWVARRQKTANALTTAATYLSERPSDTMHGIAFDPRAWEWDTKRSGPLPHTRMPVVKFTNHEGMGEFEPHTDVLDRINHQVLQRMVIATMQAWRQRAVKGLPDVYDDQHPNAGEPIDYTDVFTSDPGAFWQLPETAEMWESQPVDLRPLLEAVKDDVIALGAVTKTPLHMLQPGGNNQSAEGAASQRESLVFKVKNRIDLVLDCWSRVMSIALLHIGEKQRADLAFLEAIFDSVDQLSLAEKADAASKAQNDMPRRTRLIKIWGETPAEADQIMSEWEDELFAQQLAAQTAAAAVNPSTAPVVPQVGAANTGSPVGQTTTVSTPTVATAAGVTGAAAG
jgi:hypothetical protein